MAIQLSNAAKDVVNDALVDLIDVGAGANGVMRITTAGAAVTLADIDLDATAFGASSSGVATLANPPKVAVAAATGTAAEFYVLDKDGTTVYQGTVTEAGGGGDAIIDSVNVQLNDNVQLNSHTITAP